MDINKSGTRKEELLLPREELNRVWILRKVLNPLSRGGGHGADAGEAGQDQVQQRVPRRHAGRMRHRRTVMSTRPEYHQFRRPLCALALVSLACAMVRMRWPPAADAPSAAAKPAEAEGAPLPPPAYESALPEGVREHLNERFTGDLDQMVPAASSAWAPPSTGPTTSWTRACSAAPPTRWAWPSRTTSTRSSRPSNGDQGQRGLPAAAARPDGRGVDRRPGRRGGGPGHRPAGAPGDRGLHQARAQ